MNSLLLPYVVIGLMAVMSGIVGRNTALRFWGGFFMQLLVSVLAYGFIGPLAIIPGMLFVMFLARRERKGRMTHPYACPFSSEVRAECLKYFEENRSASNCPRHEECEEMLRKRPFYKRHATNIALLVFLALLPALLIEMPDDQKKKLPAPGQR